MIIFGIDQSSSITGWGVIEMQIKGKAKYVDSGYLQYEERPPYSYSLYFNDLIYLFNKYKPDTVVKEMSFTSRDKHKGNYTTTEISGITKLAILKYGLEPKEIANNTVKFIVGGHGRAKKEIVAQAVAQSLGIDLNTVLIKQPGTHGVSSVKYDVTDALAIALAQGIKIMGSAA